MNSDVGTSIQNALILKGYTVKSDFGNSKAEEGFWDTARSFKDGELVLMLKGSYLFNLFKAGIEDLGEATLLKTNDNFNDLKTVGKASTSSQYPSIEEAIVGELPSCM